jgi:hypothetical protein
LSLDDDDGLEGVDIDVIDDDNDDDGTTAAVGCTGGGHRGGK